MWKRWSLIRQAKLNVVRFLRLRGTPEEIAKGFALGIFIGMTPTFGIQMALAIFFAFLLRENKLAALIGVWISNPLTAPFIYALEYESGRILLGMDRVRLAMQFNFDTFKSLSWEVFLPMWVGSLVFGTLCALICYSITLRLLPSLQGLRIPRWPRKRR
ncbi:MAG: DUF2062 domain-containing protein [Desulfuromonadales bacterium]|nr:DUF2062 domain-containing protein [Desulfuromonadales bacterium]NIR33289.1 DUF2062 domain-containing protein [Desulfuromonadales bacterium]NIS40886.1 DUF2062 domain-containing protein [Desulfuromonadales bacterium]